MVREAEKKVIFLMALPPTPPPPHLNGIKKITFFAASLSKSLKRNDFLGACSLSDDLTLGTQIQK